MSAQHTPGLVYLAQGNVIGCGNPKLLDSLKINSPWVEDEWDGDAESTANMRRLVACWNACNGLSTDELERLGTMDQARVQLEVIRCEAIKQRDELLEALRGVLKHEKWHAAMADEVTPAARAAIKKADAAIAKATSQEGGAA
jgi:hypothetical protein